MGEGEKAYVAIARTTDRSRQLLVCYFQSAVSPPGVPPRDQPTLIHVINIALIIGISVVALSLVDFLLTDDQKKNIDGHILDASQRVVDIKMVSWLRWWMQTARRAHIVEGFLAIIVGLGWLAAFAACILLLIFEHSWALFWVLPSILLFWGITAEIFERVFNTVGKAALELLAKCEGVIEFIVAYILIEVVGLLPLALWFGLMYWWLGPDRLETGQIPSFVRVIGNYVGAFALIWVLTFIDGGLTLIGASVVTCAKTIIYLGQFVVWRIIIFKKGPLAAIVLLITAALGVLKLFLAK